jgi:hypothetical protein
MIADVLPFRPLLAPELLDARRIGPPILVAPELLDAGGSHLSWLFFGVRNPTVTCSLSLFGCFPTLILTNLRMLVVPPNKFFRRSALTFVFGRNELTHEESRKNHQNNYENTSNIAKYDETITNNFSFALSAPPREKILFCWAAPVHESMFIRALSRRSQTKADIRGAFAVPLSNLTNLLMLVVPPKAKNCESTFSKTQHWRPRDLQSPGIPRSPRLRARNLSPLSSPASNPCSSEPCRAEVKRRRTSWPKSFGSRHSSLICVDSWFSHSWFSQQIDTDQHSSPTH